MKDSLLNILRCPECAAPGLEADASERENGAMVSGSLSCRGCGLSFPVEKGIPRLLRRDLLALNGEEQKKWSEAYSATEANAVDDDRRTYKLRHRENAAEAGIDEEKSSYLWENLLYEEAYAAFQDVPETHGLSWTRTREAVARRNAVIFEIVARWEQPLTDRLVLNTGSGFDSDIGERFTAAGARVLNNDIVMRPLQDLRARYGLEGLCSDLRRLPFGDSSLDLAVCIEVIHHCHPLVETLTEIRRVLRDGGGIVVVENTLSHPGTWPGRILPRRLIRLIRRGLRRRFGRNDRYLKVSPYEQVVPPRQVLRVLREAGFRGIEKHVSQYAIPVFPPRVVDAWERWGRRFPPLFRPFAFEITYLARK